MTTSRNLQAFDRHLVKAVDRAQVGFYFEEGGCWGMAAALHSKLTAKGIPSELRYRPDGFVHAWVHADKLDWDYQGAGVPAGEFTVLNSVEDLRRAAEAFGIDAAQFESDQAQAEGIIQNAFYACGIDF